MEYLAVLAVIALYGWLMWWSHSQDRRQHPGYSLGGDLRSLLTGLRHMTFKQAALIVWNISIYLIGLLAFLWVAAMMGFTGPVCWRC